MYIIEIYVGKKLNTTNDWTNYFVKQPKVIIKYVNGKIKFCYDIYVKIKIIIKYDDINLPERTSSLTSLSLFLVRIRRTNLVMFKNAPFCISSIRLFVKFTESSFGWVRNAKGVIVSEREK